MDARLPFNVVQCGILPLLGPYTSDEQGPDAGWSEGDRGRAHKLVLQNCSLADTNRHPPSVHVLSVPWIFHGGSMVGPDRLNVRNRQSSAIGGLSQAMQRRCSTTKYNSPHPPSQRAQRTIPPPPTFLQSPPVQHRSPPRGEGGIRLPSDGLPPARGRLQQYFKANCGTFH